MGRARSIGLVGLFLILTTWVPAGEGHAWVLVRREPVDAAGWHWRDAGGTRVELRVRVEKPEESPSADRSPLPVPCDRGKRPPASFLASCRSLEGKLSPLEHDLFADAADGRWDEHSLVGAALVASGVVDPEAISRYQRQLARLAGELEQSGTVSGSPAEKARAVFEFMHGRILHGGYQLDTTDLSVVFDQGRFNCVSASVLFNCLAARFGLRACGLEIPGHAMSRLILPDGTLDVETTCPAWFRLMDDPQKQAELIERILGLRPGQGSSPAEPREVTDVGLVAMIYYNRGVDLLGERQFARAVAANAKALRLDPASTTARGNLLATINNWAIDLDSQGRHAEAIDLLRKGISLDPDYETFKINYVYIHSQWIEELCRADRFREALDLIVRADDDGVEETYFRRARLNVRRRWARAQCEAPAGGSGTTTTSRPARRGDG